MAKIQFPDGGHGSTVVFSFLFFSFFLGGGGHLYLAVSVSCCVFSGLTFDLLLGAWGIVLYFLEPAHGYLSNSFTVITSSAL